MSHELFNRSADLKRLRDEGYAVEVVGSHLVLRDVPYVASDGKVKTGVIISSLALAGDVTRSPDCHKVHFDGERPHQADGKPVEGILNSSGDFDLGGGLRAKHLFSSKPAEGYQDYFHKMTHYASILAGHAQQIDPEVSPKTYRVPGGTSESVHYYADTATGRAEIGSYADRLAKEKIAIIGLGGTGSYILDFVAKTCVSEVRLFDDDEFLSHNAFRAPGAASIEELRGVPMKVDYLAEVYSRMHRHIIPHGTRLTADNLDLLDGVTFAFLAIDSGEAKRVIVEKLEALDIDFVDAGMGLEATDKGITGIVRTTTSVQANREVFRDRVPFSGGGADDLYVSNVQVAELNAFNAVSAVLQWKKLRGFYCDLEGQLHSTYTVDGNMLLNEEVA
jgi:hypothetical protein